MCTSRPRADVAAAPDPSPPTPAPEKDPRCPHRLPHFVIAGAPKAGTTALHAALATHPQLYLSPVKEPKYYLTDGRPPLARPAAGPG